MNDDQVKKERCSDCGSWPSERHRTYCRKQYEQVRADVAFRAARDEVDNGMRELLLPYRSGPAEGIGVTLKRVLADYERLKAAERVTDPLRYLAPRLRPIADDNRVRRCATDPRGGA